MIRLLLCLAMLVLAGFAEAQAQPEVIKPIYRKPETPPPPQVSAPIRIVPVIDARQPCQKPARPAGAEQAEGMVELQLRVEMDGHVSDSRIVKSSGQSALDEAALNALVLCHFKPGTVDGQPETTWATIRYNWLLRQ